MTELPTSVDGCEDSDGHPLIRSLEPGEEWSYCYLDDVAMILPGVNGQARLPPSPVMGT